jgi:hypothetical protein
MEASITVFTIYKHEKIIYKFYLDGGEYAQWCPGHTFLRSVIINPILHTVCLDFGWPYTLTLKNYTAR